MFIQLYYVSQSTGVLQGHCKAPPPKWLNVVVPQNAMKWKLSLRSTSNIMAANHLWCIILSDISNFWEKKIEGLKISIFIKILCYKTFPLSL